MQDADYYMCSDEGFILHNTETKLLRLQVISDFMHWGGLQRALTQPQGVELGYNPPDLETEILDSSIFIKDI